ncbi:DUF3429 domain-containing protein [Phenylobacterium sp.]|uniref:DUF3429 domain-containing protein n=1 Tax=Phenylobacterium sp. TaxID=1871053 RepID=UPI0025EA87ED|nr:DUF3429 domain-containing protein [Phenylobacterium sp.]
MADGSAVAAGARVPPVALAYGLAGLIPFWAAPAAMLAFPAWSQAAAVVQAAYGALILSFLGGARWGMAIKAVTPDPVTIGLAMTPTLAGLALMIVAHGAGGLQLLALAGALTLAWLWDLRATDPPAWYPRLRGLLTVGAVGGLCLGFTLLAR